MSLNLHDMVRGAIQGVNEDVPGTVYVSTGRTVVRGITQPAFSAVAAALQVQALSHQRLLATRGALYAENRQTIYAYGNFSDLERPDQIGQGVIQIASTGQWFMIVQVVEWWPGWCHLEVTRQLNAANVQALIAQIQNGAVPVGAPA